MLKELKATRDTANGTSPLLPLDIHLQPAAIHILLLTYCTQLLLQPYRNHLQAPHKAPTRIHFWHASKNASEQEQQKHLNISTETPIHSALTQSLGEE